MVYPVTHSKTLKPHSMSKQELRDQLKAAGLFDKTGHQSPLWKQAFDLYKKENGGRGLCNCGGSYNRLRTWMNS